MKTSKKHIVGTPATPEETAKVFNMSRRQMKKILRMAEKAYADYQASILRNLTRSVKRDGPLPGDVFNTILAAFHANEERALTRAYRKAKAKGGKTVSHAKVRRKLGI